MDKRVNGEFLNAKSGFDAACLALRAEKHSELHQYPIARWATANDRCLPMRLLERTLGEIMCTSFFDLSVTPGIGGKKLLMLITLLERAAKTPALELPAAEMVNPVPAQTSANDPTITSPAVRKLFDAALVSEALWSEWCETIRDHNLGEDRLGRLAPSLRELPIRLWDARLNTYVHSSLAEIRGMKAHGEKRVRVILEIICVIHEMLKQAGKHSRIAVRITPHFVPPLERWMHDVLVRESPPSYSEVRDQLVLPLIEQVANDGGQDLALLVRSRLGIDGDMVSVREQSKAIGVTRARVYQRYEECEKIIAVRWPEGRRLFNELGTKYRRLIPRSAAAVLFFAAYDLFFPLTFEPVDQVLKAT